MMNRADKEALVDGLRANIEKSRAVFLTNVIGLTSNDGVSFRKGVRDSNGQVVVARNTLFERAGKGTACEKMLTGLKGPHALAFAFDDAAAVAKCLKDTGTDHEVVELKAGILNGEELPLAKLIQLASLPSRDLMLGILLATFNAPISALARVLHSIGEQKGAGAPAPVEAAAVEVEETKTEE